MCSTNEPREKGLSRLTLQPTLEYVLQTIGDGIIQGAIRGLRRDISTTHIEREDHLLKYGKSWLVIEVLGSQGRSVLRRYSCSNCVKGSTSNCVCDTSLSSFRCRVVELHNRRGGGAFKDYSVVKTKGFNCPEQQEIGCKKHIPGMKTDNNAINDHLRNRGDRRLPNMKNDAAPALVTVKTHNVPSVSAAVKRTMCR